MRTLLLIPTFLALVGTSLWPVHRDSPRRPHARSSAAAREASEIEIVEGRANVTLPRHEEIADVETTVGAPIQSPSDAGSVRSHGGSAPRSAVRRRVRTR